MLKSFREDPNYLLRYYIISTLCLLAVMGILAYCDFYHFRPSSGAYLLLLIPLLLNSIVGIILSMGLLVATFLHYYGAELHAIHFLLIPLGIYFGMINVQLIHNCAHRSFRPTWLNRPLGELLAIHLLSGFPGFVILHLNHHRYADDQELDPHPNGDLSFWQYFFSIKKKLKNYFHRSYFEQWGVNEKTKRSWHLLQILLPLNRMLRAALLLLVAGPFGFVLFMLPSFLANHLVYAHINYFTHQKQPDGSVRIMNLDSGPLYRVLNWIMLGGYSHRNHHDAPHVFNSAKLPNSLH